MLVYIVSCILSICFTYIASKNRRYFCFHILAVLIPILLLACRDISVGTDTKHYYSIFENSQEFDIASFWISTRMEYLYTLILFYVGYLGLSYNVLLFILAILTIVPVYIASFRMSYKLSPTLMMFLYYMMYYQYAFNISRQAIAMSLILLATTYLLENKKFPVVLLSFLALGFHNLTVIYCGIVVLYMLRNRGSFFMKLFFISILVILLFIFRSKFDYYEDTYLATSSSGFQVSYTITMIINFILILSSSSDSYYLRNKKNYLFFSIIILLLNLTSLLSEWFFRISLFVDILSLLMISNVLKSEQIKKKSYKRVLYILFAIFFWFFVFVINNSGETLPYTSGILSIK